MNTDIPTKAERIKCLATGEAKLNAIDAKRRMQSALTRYIPQAADR